jgi:hypothetical protein
LFGAVALVLAGTAMAEEKIEFPPYPKEKPDILDPLMPMPDTHRLFLRPAGNTPDGRIVRAFLATEQGKRLLQSWPLSDFELKDLAILVGRHRITGGKQPDLVFMLVPMKEPEYGIYGRRGWDAAALVKSDGKWRIAASMSGYGDRKLGGIMVTTEPIWGTFPDPDDKVTGYGPIFQVPPSRDGRPTMINNETGIFWDGREWQFFCWRHCTEATG